MTNPTTSPTPNPTTSPSGRRRRPTGRPIPTNPIGSTRSGACRPITNHWFHVKLFNSTVHSRTFTDSKQVKRPMGGGGGAKAVKLGKTSEN